MTPIAYFTLNLIILSTSPTSLTIATSLTPVSRPHRYQTFSDPSTTISMRPHYLIHPINILIS